MNSFIGRTMSVGGPPSEWTWSATNHQPWDDVTVRSNDLQYIRYHDTTDDKYRPRILMLCFNSITTCFHLLENPLLTAG